MLPQDGNEYKDRGDEDERQGDLGDWARGKWFHFPVGAVIVVLFVPTRKSSKEEEADESKDNGDNSEYRRQQSLYEKDVGGKHLHQVWKNDTVLESICYPYQVEWILVHGHLGRQTRCIVTAQKGSTIRVDAYAEVANTDF